MIQKSSPEDSTREKICKITLPGLQALSYTALSRSGPHGAWKATARYATQRAMRMIKVIYMAHKCLRQNKGVSKLSTAQDLKDFTTVESHSIHRPALFFSIKWHRVFKTALCNLQVSSSETRKSLSALQ